MECFLAPTNQITALINHLWSLVEGTTSASGGQRFASFGVLSKLVIESLPGAML
jgi:hypothetical protein